jgi:hypothetical protein
MRQKTLSPGKYGESPLVDLGSLIAGLHYLGIQRRRSAEGCHRLVEPFLRTYQANVSWAINPQLLSWYVAAPFSRAPIAA